MATQEIPLQGNLHPYLWALSVFNLKILKQAQKETWGPFYENLREIQGELPKTPATAGKKEMEKTKRKSLELDMEVSMQL